MSEVQTTHYDQRALGIGGSDAAPAIGVEAFGRNRVTLWQEKTGRLERPDISNERRIRRGNFLEEYIAKEYAIETGRRVRRRNATVVHPRYPFMRAHPDRMIVGERRGLEVKSVHPLASKGWGEPGTDEVPLAYLAQVVHYMACLDVDVWDLAAMFGDDLRTYTIPRNRVLEEAVIEREAAFWGYVERDEPPPPATVDEVLDLYPRDNGLSVVADDDAYGQWEALLLVRKSIKEFESEEASLEERLKVYIGERADLTDAHGRTLATWRAARSGGTDWKGAALDLIDSIAIQRAGGADSTPHKRALLEQVEQQFARPGPRKFLPKPLKELK